VNTETLQAPWQRDAETIGLIGLAHGTSHFFHLLLPPLFPALISQFGLSFTQCGLLTTVFFLVSGIGQALAGFVVDRIGPVPVLLFGVGALAGAGLLLGSASDYPMLVAVAAIAGAGNSIFHPADFTILNQKVSTPRLGHAFSSHGLAANLGWAAGAMFMGAVSVTFGWHIAGYGAGAMALLVLVILLLRRKALQSEAPAQVVARNLRSARAAPSRAAFGFLGSAAVWMCFVFFLLATGAFSVLQNFAPALLGHVYGVGRALATSALPAYLLGGAIGMVLGGFVAARVERNEAAVGIAFGISALLSIWLALGTVPTGSLLGLLALMGFGLGVAGPNRDLLVRRAATARFGASSYGRVYGFVYSGGDTGMALIPLLFGGLLDAGLFRMALAGIAALQVGALLTALGVGNRATASVSTARAA
jgi:FSR family fosmidomycin resistance protein-like MFS transporter